MRPVRVFRERHLDETFIVSSGGGIAAAVALRLASEGARVVLLGDDPSIAGAAEEINWDGGEAIACICDTGQPEAVANAIAKAVDRLGTPTGLFTTPREEAGTLASLKAAARGQSPALTSLLAPGLDEALPYLLAAGRGSIVTSAATWGVTACCGAPASPLARSVVALTRQIAGDHGRSGVRATCLCPADTMMGAGAGHPCATPAAKADLAGIASIASFLLSDEAHLVGAGPVFTASPMRQSPIDALVAGDCHA